MEPQLIQWSLNLVVRKRYFFTFSGKKSFQGQNGSGPRSAGADHLLQGGRGLGARDQVLPQASPDGPAEVGEEAGGRQRSGLQPSKPY